MERYISKECKAWRTQFSLSGRAGVLLCVIPLVAVTGFGLSACNSETLYSIAQVEPALQGAVWYNTASNTLWGFSKGGMRVAVTSIPTVSTKPGDTVAEITAKTYAAYKGKLDTILGSKEGFAIDHPRDVTGAVQGGKITVYNFEPGEITLCTSYTITATLGSARTLTLTGTQIDAAKKFGGALTDNTAYTEQKATAP
jgi:hypothetical protein